jgi:SPP1 gp7 family putative phage head morphogenesis protein
MSANDYLLDAGIKHQIYVQRYAGGQVKDLVKYLDDAQAEILRKLDGVDTLAESRSLQRKLDQIAALQRDALEKLSKGITDNAADFAEYEAEFAVKTMNTAAAASVTLPASEQLRALVTQAPMQLAISGKAGSTVQSLTLSQAATQFSKDKAAEITRTIQRGMVEGSTVQSLTRQIASVTNKHKRQAEALVRTSVNHISSEARSAVNKANDDILKGEEYVSVLDGRTTIGCAALDGKILGFDEPPFTPRHWNCRSLRVPVLQDRFQEEGLEGTRASMDGPVSAKTNLQRMAQRAVQRVPGSSSRQRAGSSIRCWKAESRRFRGRERQSDLSEAAPSARRCDKCAQDAEGSSEADSGHWQDTGASEEVRPGEDDQRSREVRSGQWSGESC